MAEKKIRLRIVTPKCIKVDEDVDMVIMRATNGDMGILPRHEACSATLDFATMRIVDNGGERRIAVYGGLALVQNDVVTILTHDAEWPEEINLARAQDNRKQAERRLHENTDDLEMQSDQVLLRRALVQIEVSSYSYNDQDDE